MTAASESEAWDASYQSSPPPWDIGHPQPELAALASSGVLRGRLLDVGCGTGEHVLMAAAHGLDATGVDVSPLAIGLAERKAEERGVTGVRFVAGDVLSPATRGELAGPFDTVIDSGVFHTFSDEDRPRYVHAIRSLLRTGGSYVMLIFSDEEPPGWGPRRVTQDELRTALRDGWRIDSIKRSFMEARIEHARAKAWLTVATAT
jgi:cyclopropane fatty-acyl-phospholipid synthase-like methyltransferase